MKLTNEQSEIVQKLINEFTKLNEKPKDGEFILLNYNALNIEKDRQIKEKKALDAHNESMRALIKQVVIDIANKMNIDIKKGNLPIKALANYTSVVIRDITCSSHDNDDVTIHVLETGTSTEFGHKICGYVFTKSYCNDTKYKTIDEVINSEPIQRGIIKLIKRNCK